MTQSNNLGITFLEQSQAQKEILINEGLSIVDAISNRGVIDKDLSTPPGSPGNGDLYIVGDSATDEWDGRDQQITWFNQIWRFIEPNEGMVLWVNDENKLYVYDGTDWIILSAGLEYISINPQTGTTYTVTASDNGKIITLSNASSITLTLPQTSAESLPQGFNIAIVQLGAGEVTVAKQGSDNLYSEGNKLKLNAQYAQATIVKTVAGSPNTWIMSGSLKA